MDHHCDNYAVGGLIKDTFFKLHGCPEWYKDLKNKKCKTSFKVYVNFADTTFHNDQDSMIAKSSKENNLVNFSYLGDFAGPSEWSDFSHWKNFGKPLHVGYFIFFFFCYS